jgi:hypothetical protein
MNTQADPVRGLRFVTWDSNRNAYDPIIIHGVNQTIYNRRFQDAPVHLTRISTFDQFSRPATRFTLRGLEIGLYEQTPILTYTAVTPQATIGEAIQWFVHTNIAAHVNGRRVASITGMNAFEPALTATGTSILEANLARDIARLTGNGVLVEVFLNEAQTQISRVTAIQTDISTVIRNDTARGQVVVEARVGSAAGNSGARLRHTLNEFQRLFDTVRDLAVGTQLLVAPVHTGLLPTDNSWGAGTIEFPTTVTGTVARTVNWSSFGDTGTITFGDTVYQRASVISDDGRNPATTEREGTLTFDTYGYIVHSDITPPLDTTLVFVERSHRRTLDGNILRNLLDGFLPTGERVSLPVNEWGDPPYGGTLPNGTLTSVDTRSNVATPTILDLASPTAMVTTLLGTTNNNMVVIELNDNGFIRRGDPVMNPDVAGAMDIRIPATARYFYWDSAVQADGRAGRWVNTGRTWDIEVEEGDLAVLRRSGNTWNVVAIYTTADAPLPTVTVSDLYYLTGNRDGMETGGIRMWEAIRVETGEIIEGGIAIAGNSANQDDGFFYAQSDGGVYTLIQFFDAQNLIATGSSITTATSLQGFNNSTEVYDRLQLGATNVWLTIPWNVNVVDARGEAIRRPNGQAWLTDLLQAEGTIDIQVAYNPLNVNTPFVIIVV